MKIICLFSSVIFLLLGCKTKTETSSIPDDNLIHEIIIQTIKLDSLDTSLPVSSKLGNYYLYQTEYKRNSTLEFPPPPPPPPPSEKGEPLIFEHFRLNMEKLIGYSITSADSVSFQKQINSHLIELDSNKLRNVIQIENMEQKGLETYRNKKYYKFLIPLFNHDKSIVWTRYDYHCPACGYGKLVILKNTNNTWQIVDSFITWIN